MAGGDPTFLAQIKLQIDELPTVFKFLLDIIGGAIAFTGIYYITVFLNDLAQDPHGLDPAKVWWLKLLETILFFADVISFGLYVVCISLTHGLGFIIMAVKKGREEWRKQN